ncbi:MAG: hypothetical protein LCH73_12840 [Proteobacteria bacterium]|nr:hypothetical protein [Pseudomonadota bacterium]
MSMTPALGSLFDNLRQATTARLFTSPYILLCMRRWFIAFLALVMVAQFSWAATARCCLNEVVGTASNVEASSTWTFSAYGVVDIDDSGEPAAACDAGHGHSHCHHSCVAMHSDEHAAPVPADHATPSVLRQEPGTSHIPEGLDRPNW